MWVSYILELKIGMLYQEYFVLLAVLLIQVKLETSLISSSFSFGFSIAGNMSPSAHLSTHCSNLLLDIFDNYIKNFCAFYFPAHAKNAPTNNTAGQSVRRIVEQKAFLLSQKQNCIELHNGHLVAKEFSNFWHLILKGLSLFFFFKLSNSRHF